MGQPILAAAGFQPVWRMAKKAVASHLVPDQTKHKCFYNVCPSKTK
jgi:hypothetical protein